LWAPIRATELSHLKNLRLKCGADKEIVKEIILSEIRTESLNSKFQNHESKN